MEPQQDIDDVIRPRLQKAVDDFLAAGHAVSLRQVAIGAGVDYDHLRKYLKGGEKAPGMEFKKIARVATHIHVDLSWLVGGTRQMSGRGPRAPRIDAGRLPMDVPRDKMHEAIAALPDAQDMPNPTTDPTAWWADLIETFGDYRSGDPILISPANEPALGEPAAAFVGRRLVVGTKRLFKQEECLVLSSGEIFAPGDYYVLGVIARHQRRPVDRI